MRTFVQHLKFALRNIFKQRVYSSLNILGFALGFTICIISGLYIYREFNIDKSFDNYQHIYRMVNSENNTTLLDYDIAERIRDRFPEIKKITPTKFLHSYDFTIRRTGEEDYVTLPRIISTEKDFFSLFSIDFIAGNPVDPFNSEESFIITESLAFQLFERTDVLGEHLFFNGRSLPINAVVREMPENSSMKSDLFLSSVDPESRIGWTCRNGNDICYSPYSMFILLDKETDVKALEEKINANFPENKDETKSILLQPLSAIYFDKTVNDSTHYQGNTLLIFVFMTVALIILILSVINYVNFALSRQLDTLKQLGIKMTYGASMKQLKIYHLIEIGVSILIAFILSLIIGLYSLPVFEYVLGVPLKMSYLFTPTFSLAISAVLAGVILISSLTPFYIISKFDIQMLFGKKQTYFGKQRGKMVLTGCQMGITVVMFVCLFMIQKQLDYVKNYDLGFDKDHFIQIQLTFPYGYEALRNEIAQYNFVQSASYSSGAPGFAYYTEGQYNEHEGDNITIYKLYGEPDFMNTFDIELLEGRYFTNADRGKSCIVSEEIMRRMGWDTFEGKKCNGQNVIGVAKDFNISSLHNRMEPVNILCAGEDMQFEFLNVRFTGSIPEALEQLRQSYKKVYADHSFEYRFYNEVFEAYYKTEERQSHAIAIISFVAIIITCMGLIGQVKQTSISKAKEIGIRKINGATVVQMMLVIPRNFWRCFAFAFVFAVPVAWIAMNKWLENFAFKTDISWWIFALSGVVVFVILTLFILWQTWKAATTNPVEIIKSE